VTRANGQALSGNMKASLVLPMGRFGPAFLAYDNFQAYLKWNASLMYSLTAAYYATRLDGAPAMYRGTPNIPKLTIDQNRDLQQILTRMGHDVGRVDGVLGTKSRTAIREVQIKFGMPADSWPTAELLERLQRGR
jgi:peptidoglycan hydrolase-like protein with peptidoglycan-binding domain